MWFSILVHRVFTRKALRTYLVPSLPLKVRKFQNEYMKLSHCPKHKPKKLKNSVRYIRRNFSEFFIHILGNATLHMFILKFPDLYMHALCVSVFYISRLLYLKNSLSVRFSGQSSTVSPFIQHLFFLYFLELIWFHSFYLDRQHSENESQKKSNQTCKKLQFSHIHISKLQQTSFISLKQ